MGSKLIFFLIVIVIAIVRGLNKNAQKDEELRQKQRGQARAQAPERRRKVQSDIDAFLSEVSNTSGNRPDRAAQRPQKRRSQRSQTPRKKSARAEAQRGQRSKPRRQRPDTTQPAMAASPVTERSLGSGISEHVDTYIAQHVADHVDSHVDELVEVDIVDSVDSHLGDRAAELPSLTSATADDAAAPAERFRQLLRSPEGVQQAILLNEILARPRSLR